MRGAFTICVTCKEKFDGRMQSPFHCNRKPGARTAGPGAQRDKSAMLFPNSKGGVIKQASFAHRINRLAYDHDIAERMASCFASRRISSVTPLERA